jgi:hypothetical protein
MKRTSHHSPLSDEHSCLQSIPTQAVTIKLSMDEQWQFEADLGVMLQTAIERTTSTPWRSVSSTVAVERIEPYRTLVVRGDDLRQVERWQRELNCSCIPHSEKRRELTLTLEPKIPLEGK